MSQPERSEGKGLATPDQSRFAQGDTARVQGLPTADNRWSVQCLNCQAPLSGAFCSSCGQRAVPSHPTIKELAGDAVSEFFGWDGKFAESFRALVNRPGELTREWIEGRRVHYISPFRLYVTASLVYFAIAAAAPNIRPVATDGSVDVGGVRLGPGRPGAAQRLGNEAQAAVTSNQPLTGTERDSAEAEIARSPEILRPIFRRAIEQPEEFSRAIRRAMPNVFMLLVPIFGGILALFYRRRNYPEHLYFAIHLFAFLFIARAIGNLALFTRSVVFAGIVQVAMMIWIVAYCVSALRRVYGGSIPKTMAKAAGAWIVYGIVAIPIIVGTAMWVVR